MNFESGFLIQILSRKKLKNTLGLGSFKRQTCSVEHQAHTIFGGQRGHTYRQARSVLCFFSRAQGPLALNTSASAITMRSSSLPLTNKCLYLAQGKNK